MVEAKTDELCAQYVKRVTDFLEENNFQKEGGPMKRVISIVEDEKDINNLVAQYLRKEGYEVHSYYTYEEASAHVADDDVHLWILDIMWF